MAYSKSALVMGSSLKYSALSRKRASGKRPKSMITSIRLSLLGCLSSFEQILVGKISSNLLRLLVICILWELLLLFSRGWDSENETFFMRD